MSTAVAPGTRTGRINGRQTFGRAIAAEWVKLRTLASTWITSVIAVGLAVLIGAGLSIVASSDSKELLADQAPALMVAGITFGQIAMAVLGALIVTGEYSSG